MDSSDKMGRITFMDPVLYKAAEEGNIHPFENYQACVNRLLTPNENTILHVYLRNQSREPEFTDFVDIILELCPSLLLQANKKGETPLHLAARYGYSNVVKVLIDRAKALPTDPKSGVTEAKKMLRMINEEQDTALHEAARKVRSHVVEILTKEDPDFSYSSNVHGETPLYIAVSIGTKWGVERAKVIDEILKNCISVDFGGPNGRSALHAAIMEGDDATARKMLEKETSLTKTIDQNGWSPLHYAAYFCSLPLDDISVVKVLLDYDPSAAFIADKEKKRTPLHIAAIQGYINVMKEIVSRCPACCEVVDNRGWNALHYVVASKKSATFNKCLEIPELLRLETEKDEKGNTPMHLVAALSLNHKYWKGVFTKDSYGLSGIYGLNKQKLSIKDIFYGNVSEIQKEILESLEDVGSGPFGRGRIVLKEEEEENNEEEASLGKSEEVDPLNKARESHLVAAALIATVTFAAAFTLPGGYESDGPDKGTAVLTKKAAFIVFVISDAMAMVLSTCAVFIHFLMALIQGFDEDKNFDEAITIKLFMLATLLTMIAMATMVITFVTGTYVVLVPSLGLAIGTCLIGLSFFFLVYLVYRIIYKYFKDEMISI